MYSEWYKPESNDPHSEMNSNSIVEANRKNKTGIYSYIFIFAVELLLLHLVMQPLNLGLLTEVPLLLYCILFFYFIFQYITQYHNYKVLVLQFLGVVMLVGAFLVSILGGTQLSIGYVQRFLCVIFVMLMFGFTEKTVRFTKKELKVVYVSFCLYTLILVIYSLMPWAHTMGGGVVTSSLTLNYSNPNFTGEILMSVVFVLGIGIKSKIYEHNKLGLVLLFVSLYLLYLTQCRTAFFTSLLFVIYMVMEKKVRVRKAYIVIFFFLPILFVPAYSAFVNSSFSDLTFLGKSVSSGRDIMYSYYIEEMKSDPITIFVGNMGRYQFGNLHNGPFAVLGSSGVFAFLIFYYIWLTSLCSKVKYNNSPVVNLSLFAFCCLFLHSCTEAGLILGGALSSLILFFLVNCLNYTD